MEVELQYVEGQSGIKVNNTEQLETRMRLTFPNNRKVYVERQP